MDLSSLLPALRQSVEPENAIASGLLPLPTSARAPVAASMLIERSAPLLIVSPRFDRVLTLAQELPYWAPQTPVAIFPEPDPPPMPIIVAVLIKMSITQVGTAGHQH